jgi:outer membrane protein assembly factor BamB
MRTAVALLGLLALASGLIAGEAAPPVFTKKPAVTKAGDKVMITFAVDRETDVAVFIEDAKGVIVRHLVAGVLGKNPPEPLKANSLEQSVEWDGKDDDGRPVSGVSVQVSGAQPDTRTLKPETPLRVRVAAGMKVGYAGTAFSDKTGPNNIADVMGMAVGPDGRLYVLSHRWQRYVGYSTAVHVFRRDGAYEQTIKPFHGNLAEERIKPLGAFRTKEEGLVPIVYSANIDISYYPNVDIQQQPAFTPDGRLVLAVKPSPGYWNSFAYLAVIDGDGGIPGDKYAGPPFGAKEWDTQLVAPFGDGKGGFASFNIPYLAASQDGKAVYLTGLRTGGLQAKRALDHAVYGAPLPERGPIQLVFGDPAAAGNDDKHLSDPRGVAVDGKGHILVADFGNNRVVVLNEKDKTMAGSFPADAPFWVGANAKTGAIYVGTKQSAVVKFSGWPDPKEVARADFAAQFNKINAHERPGTPLHLALDASAEKPLLWAAYAGSPYAAAGGPPLRLEDLGTSFSDAKPVDAYSPIYPWNLSADPLRREVSCQSGGIRILNEETGKIADVAHPFGAEANLVRLGLNGQVFGQGHSSKLKRFDRKGKLLPFEATAGDKALNGQLNNQPEGTTAWPRDFCVDRRGDIYVKNRNKDYHGLMSVEQHSPDGALKRTAIWMTTDGALGPRVDLKGNIYMGECVKPLGQPYPEIFSGRLPKGKEAEYVWMYGSLVKYGPKGGAAWYPTGTKWALPYAGECKLDPALKKEKVSGTRGTGLIKEMELQGAEWFRPGLAYLLDMGGCGTDRCHCTACDFDVDDFGRSFCPNQGLFRVEVADTNGNKILNIGGYGNQDHCGPDSYVMDPAGKFLRPRKADDPKDLKSPFAEPELAFNWFTGLAVTDRHLYVADGNNRRVLRGRIEYAATETAVVP